jgi:hypothetical protein
MGAQNMDAPKSNNSQLDRLCHLLPLHPKVLVLAENGLTCGYSHGRAVPQTASQAE